MRRVRRNPLYFFAMLAAATVMLLLPVLYLGLIAGVAYATYWHATNGVPQNGNGRGIVFLYLGPLIVGVLLLIFLIKPILKTRVRSFSGVAPSPEEQPQLFALVREIAGATGASMPREIRIDCEVNASASFRRGLWSMFGSDLTLTIGLPLVQAMTVRQLSGVIAHELGHFSQGLGMRVSVLVWRIDNWFARAVYERDEWDEFLSEQSAEIGLYFGIILYFGRLMVWLTRGVLWCLLWLGRLVNCFLLRRMEFDADRHEIRVAGSDAFEQTHVQLELLSRSWLAAHQQLRSQFRERRMPDDMPRLIECLLGSMPDSVQAETRKSINEEQGGWLATHPAARDRIAAARSAGEPGVIASDEPARSLFANYEGLCQVVTRAHYADRLDLHPSPQELVPTSQVLGAEERVRDDFDAIERFFGIELPEQRGLLLPLVEIPTDPRQAAQLVRQARTAVRQRAPEATKLLKRYADVHAEQQRAIMAGGLASSNIRIESLPQMSREEAERAVRAADSKLRNISEQLTNFETDCANLLAGLIGLLGHESVANLVEDAGTLREEMLQLRELLSHLNVTLRDRDEYDRLYSRLLAGCLGAQQDPDHPVPQSLIRVNIEMMYELLKRVRNEYRDIDYPFVDAGGALSVRQYLLPELPSMHQPFEIVYASDELSRNLLDLHARAVARLAGNAVRIDQALQKARKLARQAS